MRLEDISRPSCPVCGKELAVHSRRLKSDFEREKSRVSSMYPELADRIPEWDGRTQVTRYRCSKCKQIYNASYFGDKKYYNETKIPIVSEKSCEKTNSKQRE